MRYSVLQPRVDMTQTPDEEAAINTVLYGMPVLESQAPLDLDDTLRLRLAQDIAYKIYPIEEIAIRYGFGTVTRLRQWLVLNPGLVAEIGRLRAINESDAATKDRAALKAQHAIEQAIPSVSAMITNPGLAGDLRLKALDGLLHVGGFRGGGAAAKDAVTGAQFNLVMQFQGAPPVTISPTVVEATAVPAIADGVSDDETPEDDA